MKVNQNPSSSCHSGRDKDFVSYICLDSNPLKFQNYSTRESFLLFTFYLKRVNRVSHHQSIIIL